MSETSSAADNNFLDDAGFDSLFAGDALIGVTGGAGTDCNRSGSGEGIAS